MMDKKEIALEMLGTIAGGGLAGLLDVEMSTTMPLGLPVGAVGGIALVAAGFLGASMKGTMGTVCKSAGEVGLGMIAFETGTAVAARVLKAKVAAASTAPAATTTVSGLPAGRRPVTADSIRQHLGRMRAAA